MEWLTDKLHALIFYPPASTSSDGAELQPLLWIHGGPMCVVSFDYSPFLCWLASLGVCVCVCVRARACTRVLNQHVASVGWQASILDFWRILCLPVRMSVWVRRRPVCLCTQTSLDTGFVVCVPNFSGSTGFGVEHMDSVLGKGCGIADLADCLAAAQYMRGMTDARVDLRRGVGVAGHSWGGYLSLMCMTQLQESMSSVQGSAGARAHTKSHTHARAHVAEAYLWMLGA